MTRVEEKAIDAWAIYEYREHPKGLYHTCFVDGYQQGYGRAEKDSILNPYIESMRRQIERKIADMPPAPEGYRYSWKLEDFSREGDSFSITSNIVLKPIDPERDEHNSKLNEDLLDAAKDALLLERAWLTLDNFGHEELAERLREFAERKGRYGSEDD